MNCTRQSVLQAISDHDHHVPGLSPPELRRRSSDRTASSSTAPTTGLRGADAIGNPGRLLPDPVLVLRGDEDPVFAVSDRCEIRQLRQSHVARLRP